MINFEKVTDPYERRARLYPALICLLPLIVSISLSFPSLFTTLSGLAVLVVSLGGLQLLTQLARDRGKRLEKSLFEEWGGMPSVAIFRFSDQNIPLPAKQRYHEIVSSETGIEAPTKELEMTSPKQADAIYLSWSDYLRGKTRDVRKYPMVFKENINYGFRRNLFGIKWFCVFSGFLSIIVIAIPISQSDAITETQIGIMIAIMLYILIFIIVVNKDWVRITAFAYAKQLVESINS